MAIDPLEEKASMLAKLGSFWTRILQGDAKTKARSLSHIQFLMRVYGQLDGAIRATVNGAYWYDHYRVVRFSDADIDYYGSFAAYQKRYSTGNEERGYSRGNTLTIDDSFVGATETDHVVADTESQAVAFPGGDGDAVIMEDHVAVYSVKLDDDMCIHTIDAGGGKLMVAGFDFISEFGRVTFAEDPIALFPSMKFMAASVTRRKKSIYSYTLGVDGCYGDVSRVWHYYRESQSPEAFRKALYQACGLPVVKAACYIKDVVPLGSGWSYFTNDGERYDAAFPHTKLPRLTELKEGQAIGTDMLAVVLPGEELPAWTTRLAMEHALSGVGSLSAPDEVRRLYGDDNQYHPLYDGTQADLESYYATLTPVPEPEAVAPDPPVSPINDKSYASVQQIGPQSIIPGVPKRIVLQCGAPAAQSDAIQQYTGDVYCYIQEQDDQGQYVDTPVICSTTTSRYAEGGYYEWMFDTNIQLSGRPFRLRIHPNNNVSASTLWNNTSSYYLRFKAVLNKAFSEYSVKVQTQLVVGIIPDIMVYTYMPAKEFPDEKNLITHVREDLFPGRHIVVCLRDTVSDTVARRALTFADRERPVGSVVLVGR